MKVIGSRYAYYFNKQLNRTGTLWEGRHKASLIQSERYLVTCDRYIELNPVRAGLVQYAWEWPWSSARAHVTGRDESELLTMDQWRARFDCESWKQFLEEGSDSSVELDRIRLATITGRPLGGENFITLLEALTGRLLRHRKSGHRPIPQSDG